jgi:hypothetical protein
MATLSPVSTTSAGVAFIRPKTASFELKVVDEGRALRPGIAIN